MDKKTLRQYVEDAYTYGSNTEHVRQRVERIYKDHLNNLVMTLEAERQMGNWLIDCPVEIFEFMERRKYGYRITMEEAQDVLKRIEPQPATEAH